MPESAYTPQQKAEFKAEFAVRRRRRWLGVAVIFIAVLVVVLTGNRIGGPLLGIGAAVWQPVGVVVVLGAVVFSLINWRCPACGRYLGRTINPAFCPRCGIALRD